MGDFLLGTINSMSVDEAQVEKAVTVLNKVLEKKRKSKKSALLDEVEFFELQITLNKSLGKSKPKPLMITLPNPIYEADPVDICVFTKDPQKKYKEMIRAEYPEAKVIGLAKLKKTYATYESKRKLIASYDLFFADEKIKALLPPLLGKEFFERKKTPALIKIHQGNVAQALEKALKCTRLIRGSSLNVSVKIGHTGQSSAEITQNVVAAMRVIVNQYVKEWDNILSLHLKTPSTTSLPFYNALPSIPSDSEEEAEGNSDGEESE